jgi:hypothetical protein
LIYQQITHKNLHILIINKIILRERKMIDENISFKSDIEIQIIDTKTKEVIKVIHAKNIMTNNGIKWIRNQIANISSLEDPDYNVDTRLTHIAVGDSNTPVASTQDNLGNELLRKELHPTPDIKCEITINGINEVVYTMFISDTELNGEILREIGLFSESYTNFMISRALIGNLTKTDVVEFKINYKYTVSNGSA